ncbi:MAG: hypothetical protein N2053_10730, partial [Chitinispirillaceae bacterium]|nr:hypothetical protein [Chitinispirillaceae bacterium]
RFRAIKPINIDNLFTDTAVAGILSSGGAILWQAGWGFSIKKILQLGIGYVRYNFDQTLIKVTEIYGTTYNRISDSSSINFATNGIRGGFIV